MLKRTADTERHPHIRARKMIDRIVLGSSDGVIESIAVTSGLNGAGSDFRTILVVGLAFALAGALSMFFSNYLARKSELDSLKIDIDRERMEIETEPEEERQELEELLRKEGYGQREVDVILNRVRRDKELWLRAQLRHELQLYVDDLRSDPFKTSSAAGGFFFLGAALPLVTYLAPLQHFQALMLSVVVSLTVLFLLGATKFTFLRHFNFKNGAQMVVIGGFAALLLYAMGRILALL